MQAEYEKTETSILWFGGDVLPGIVLPPRWEVPGMYQKNVECIPDMANMYQKNDLSSEKVLVE